MGKDLLDRLTTLQERYKALSPALHLEDKQKELMNLHSQMEDPIFWNSQEQAQKVSQKAAHLEKHIHTWQNIEQQIKDFPELIDMAEDSDLNELMNNLNTLEQEFSSLETELFLSGEFDQGNAILSIHVGNGGQDAEDFTAMLLRMYLRFCEQKGYKTTIFDESTTEDGLKSATVEISGPMAYGWMKGEQGVHRLIRLSPFNAKNLRQTSFAGIEVLPEIEDEKEMEIDPNDLRIDVFRSSGCGGQSVNTTDSAVRITYVPLNIVVTCQNEKSQLQNKESAMKVLKSRLLKLKHEQHVQKLEEIRGDRMDANFGSQIRTYTLHPYKMVKDHRTDFEHSNPEKVLDGDLDGFVEAYLRKKS